MKRFVAMDGPVFETEPKIKMNRLKIYLDEEAYEDLAKIAKDKGVTPSKLLAMILTDWCE